MSLIKTTDTFRRPRILILGHARHGKDTAAEIISEIMGLKFISSSRFVAEEIIWPMWGQERYATFEDMFEDRVNFRATWKNLIRAYNTPDLTRTTRTMLERGYDIYVGMRDPDEYISSKDQFDLILWIDRSKECRPEDRSSMGIVYNPLQMMMIDNNQTVQYLRNQVEILRSTLHSKGYDVGMPSIPAKESKKTADKLAEIESWKDLPTGATPVLDHGFINLLDHMGNDHDIAEAARMSYGRGTKKVRDDSKLLRYLLLNHHTSPFEMAEIKVHMRLPIFVMRQWVRHRTANLNEYSGRYSEMPRLFYIPNAEHICGQHDVNRQGSGDPLPLGTAALIQNTMRAVSNKAFDDYEMMLASGVSRETARIILPLNTYTEIVWKIDLNNLIKFLMLRDDSHAQWEIRAYAIELDKIFRSLFPETHKVYREIRDQVILTRAELLAVCTNNPKSPQWGLGKGQIAKVQGILGWLKQILVKPN